MKGISLKHKVNFKRKIGGDQVPKELVGHPVIEMVETDKAGKVLVATYILDGRLEC